MLSKIAYISLINWSFSILSTVSNSKLNGLNGSAAKNSIKKSSGGQKLKCLQNFAFFTTLKTQFLDHFDP